MKNKLLLLLVLSAVTAGCKSPSQEVSLPIRDNGIARIEKYPTEDLRILFRSPDLIRRLERENACLVVTGLGGARSAQRTVGRDGCSVAQFMRRSFTNGYDGQVKVVSRDSIVQTPVLEYDEGKQSEMQIRPGDLVLIMPRE
jgi:hypothetical protein